MTRYYFDIRDLVEDGVTDLDDVLKERLDRLKADRDRARAALEASKSQQGAAIHIDPALIEAFWSHNARKLDVGIDSIPEGLPALADRRSRGG